MSNNEDPSKEPSSSSSNSSQPTNKAQDRPSFWANALSGVTRDDKRSWFSTAKKSEETPAESTTNSVKESVSTTGRDTDADTNRLAQLINSFVGDSKNFFKPQNKHVEKSYFDEEGTPIAPPTPLPETDRDSDLYSLLSSPSILNGPNKGKGKEQQRADTNEFQPAVLWSVLDRSRADDRSDTSSLMIYSPIIPTMDSLVEVAETISTNELVKPAATPEPEPEASPQPPPPVQSTWKAWAFSSFRRAPNPPAEVAPTPPTRVWIPSKTKLSMQVMWWGYRIYLPPAVLEILSNKQLEATKRATIITTALQWLIGNIPLAAIPPPLQPIVFLLQQLVPVVGYVGAFIAWSWSAVKSFDTGNGVTLTATWILPVALIPATWDSPDTTTDSGNTEASDTASLLTATPSRLSVEEAQRAFSLPPPTSTTSASTSVSSAGPSTSFIPPSASSSTIPPASASRPSSHLSPRYLKSPHHVPFQVASRAKPRKFGSAATPTSPSPIPLKDRPHHSDHHHHSSHRRPHGAHRSATVPAGNALGLYTPESPAMSYYSLRSTSTPRIKSPLSTSSTITDIGESSKPKKVKHSCCASCTAAMAARQTAMTPRLT